MTPVDQNIAAVTHPGAAQHRMGDAARALVQGATAAHAGPGGPATGMADVAAVLWTRFLRFDATDPRWPDRDRFVLSSGQGTLLFYALLQLTGHAGMDTESMARCGQLDSPAAGHPEYGDHPAIEFTGGSPGQGLAAAVGMALAERMLAARFGRSLVDHRTWVVASDGDLMQGISHEAACLAGQWRLEKLTVLWEDTATAPGADAPAFDSSGPADPTAPAPAAAGDTLKRFAAAGWATKRIDGHDPLAIASALSLALRSRKPTLIACRTRPDEAKASSNDGLDAPPANGRDDPAGNGPGALPGNGRDDSAERWARAGARGTPARRAWLKRLTNHPQRTEFERVTAGRLPEAWHEATAALKLQCVDVHPARSTRASSATALAALAAAIPELVGGSADRGGSDLAALPGMTSVTQGSYAGRVIDFGLREHGMAACLNGMALHGGLIPYAGTLFVSTDQMRPALRLAALMRQRVIHVLTHDSIGLGADGPAQQPIEHLASLRAMPGLFVMRPADAVETAECWELALRRADGPSLLVLSHQPVPQLRTDAAENRAARGGYVLAEADGPRQATLVASGSEVALAIEARRLLAGHGIPAAVVSLPSWELFATQDESFRAQVLGTALRVGIEAACGFGWERWLGPDGIFIGMTGFGASAPADTLYRHFGITPEAVVSAVRKRLQPSSPEGI